MNRREFLKIVATTSAAVAAASCSITRKSDNVVPYLVPPDPDIIPGMPIFYKSTCTECSAHCGLNVKAYDKIINNQHTITPVKLEGSLEHPINKGGLCIRGQASLTRLYHPDRIQSPILIDKGGKTKKISWEDAYKRILDEFQKAKGQGKKNIYLSGRTTGSLAELIDVFSQKLDIDRLPEFELLSYASLRAAYKSLFNRNEIPYYDIENADFLLTLGVDIVGTFVSPVSNGKQFAGRLKKEGFHWTHLEPHLTLSGLSANQRIVLTPSSEAYLLAYLLKNSNHRNKSADSLISLIPNVTAADVTSKTGITSEVLSQILDKLNKSSKPLLIAGEISTGTANGYATALLTGLLQLSSGMVGSTVDFTHGENYSRVGTNQDLQLFSDRLGKNEIGVVIISRTNPVEGSEEFEKNIHNATFRVGFGSLLDETLKQCDLVLPLSHSLESWGDASPRKNVISVIQPTLKPIFDTRSEGDILLDLISYKEQTQAQTYQLYLFDKWKKSNGDGFTDGFLKNGYSTLIVANDNVTINQASGSSAIKSVTLQEPAKSPSLAIVPSLRAFDGRGKALPLLNEIPDPLTTISWGDWVSISNDTAKSLSLNDGDGITITSDKGTFEYPVKIQPELKSNMMVVQCGHISVKSLSIDKNSGDNNWLLENVKVQKSGKFTALPILSGSMSQKGRGIIPEPIDKKKHEEYNQKAGLYDEPNYPDYRWAMAIDLDSCTGCSACVAACYVENNIPVVGKKDHLDGREMSWIRIEPFFETETREIVPMLCQQCDYAPCESVCPVYATYHNPEGLNAQVYNRCVGTRYCSNNCPYKVRRFNWFDHEWKAPMDRMLNPEMSVRGRGVMEKCTFCVQRVRSSKDRAKDEGRKVKDGEMIPACAQTCPTNAITFGNLKDKESLVYKAATSERAYRVFDYLGVEPGVYYLSDKNKEEKK